MSVKVSSWAWHDVSEDVAGNELVLLLALADVADDNGRCRFLEDEDDLTYVGLARKVRVSRSTIIRLVSSLRRRELVEHLPGVKGRPNGFKLRVPWAPTSGVNLEPNGSDSVSSVSGFGSKSDVDTSLIRRDVSSAAQKARRGTRLSPDWAPSEALRAEALVKFPSVDIDFETDSFVDYWVAKAGASAVKLDWDLTWRGWLRRAHQRNVERGWKPAVVVEPGLEYLYR
jgi:hypothetical protein